MYGVKIKFVANVDSLRILLFFGFFDFRKIVSLAGGSTASVADSIVKNQDFLSMGSVRGGFFMHIVLQLMQFRVSGLRPLVGGKFLKLGLFFW